MRIYSLRASGMSIDKNLDNLSRSDISVARGTVAKYTKKYDNLSENIKKGYAPFEWQRPEEFGIPAKGNCFLLRMWAYALEHAVNHELPPATHEGHHVPTVRQVTWWWRVHLAAPDAPRIDVLIFAEELANRELLDDLGYGPRATDDIWGYFVFAPWTQVGKQRYERAIASRAIEHWWIVGRSDRRRMEQLLAVLSDEHSEHSKEVDQ